MQFNVPQFIEIEDKVVGPFTFKQFVYLAGGAGAVFILWRTLPLFLSIWLILPIAAASLALAFLRINKRPFVIILEAAVRYWLSRKLYVWRKEEKKVEPKERTEKPEPLLTVPKLSESKLKELAWSLDVNENIK